MLYMIIYVPVNVNKTKRNSMSDFINDLYNNSPVSINDIRYEIKKEEAMEIKTVVVTDEAPISYDCVGCNDKYTNYNASPFCSYRCEDNFNTYAPIELIHKTYEQIKQHNSYFTKGRNQ